MDSVCDGKSSDVIASMLKGARTSHVLANSGAMNMHLVHALTHVTVLSEAVTANVDVVVVCGSIHGGMLSHVWRRFAKFVSWHRFVLFAMTILTHAPRYALVINTRTGVLAVWEVPHISPTSFVLGGRAGMEDAA